MKVDDFKNEARRGRKAFARAVRDECAWCVRRLRRGARDYCAD